MYKSTDPAEKIPVGAEIIIDGGRVGLIAPADDAMTDAAHCPTWCAVDWHADPRMWEPVDGELPSVAGSRLCLSAERVVEVPGTDPIRIWLERYQRFSFHELAQGHALHCADAAGLHLWPIHYYESHLPASAVASIAGALTELHAAMLGGELS